MLARRNKDLLPAICERAARRDAEQQLALRSCAAMTDTARVAYYDYIYFLLACLAAAGWVLPPLATKRKGIGTSGYTIVQYMQEGRESNRKLSVDEHHLWTSDPDAPPTAWWCQRQRWCHPFDHLLYFRVVYISAVTVVLSFHFQYYITNWFGEGQIGDRTDSLVWFSLFLGLSSALVCILWHALQDLIFFLTAWGTAIIWIIRLYGQDIRTGLDITIITLTLLAAVVLLVLCTLWSCFPCWRCCCGNTISHWLAKKAVRTHMYASLSMGIALGFAELKGIANYLNVDHTWYYNVMIAFATLFVMGFPWRFLFQKFCLGYLDKRDRMAYRKHGATTTKSRTQSGKASSSSLPLPVSTAPRPNTGPSADMHQHRVAVDSDDDDDEYDEYGDDDKAQFTVGDLDTEIEDGGDE